MFGPGNLPRKDTGYFGFRKSVSHSGDQLFIQRQRILAHQKNDLAGTLPYAKISCQAVIEFRRDTMMIFAPADRAVATV